MYKNMGLYLAVLSALMLASCADGDSDKNTDDYRAQLGDYCDTSTLCEEQLECVKSVCVEYVGKDSACDATHVCKEGVCTNQVCVVSDVSSGCKTDSDCQNAVCVNGECRPSSPIDCKNGSWNDASSICTCHENFKTDASGACTLCIDGYEFNNNTCIKKTDPTPDQPNPPTPGGDCQFTFYYSNQWTHTDTGGSAEFDVYLVGSMNTTSDGTWKTDEDNDAYKMTYQGKGVHAITIDTTSGAEIKYKFYVSGWAENSWQSDPANPNKDDDLNGIINVTCGGEMGDKTPYEPVAADCGHGTYQDGGGDASRAYCKCDTGYKMDDSKKCTVCDTGYRSDNGECTKIDIDETKCETTFTYFNQWTNKASGGADDFDVYLVGSMNKTDDGTWILDDANYKMTSNNNGTHSITVSLKKGETYSYKYHVNGWKNEETGQDDGWFADPANTKYDLDGNSVAEITQCGLSFGSSSSQPDPGTNPVDPTPGTDPGTDSGAISLAGVPTVKDKTIEFTIHLSESAGANLKVSGGSGSASLNGTVVKDTVTENNKYIYTITDDKGNSLYVPVWVEDKKFEWKDALLYFAFTDRFKNGDTSNDAPATDASVSGTSNARWMGGDFKGLLEKVEAGYFDDLGVNTLWISSVSMNTQGVSWGTGSDSGHSYSAYHSYWPVSTFMTANNQADFTGLSAIEPHFGSMDDLKALVNACHKRGIRVLVDFAANHVHKDSPIYKKKPEWFNGTAENAWICDSNNGWDKAPETCWFSADLPDINYNNVDARKLMVEHAVWLIRETGIDGFRVDAVKHMAVQFIKDLRAAVDQLFRNTGITFYMVGETFTGDVNLLNQYIGDDLLHAQFDFPLYYALQDVLVYGSMYNVFNNATSYKIGANIYKSDLMGTFMGNHDVARAISVAAKQNTGKWGSNEVVTNWIPYFRVKQAWTILLTNPGVPLIYYGDEYGMTGANDPDNRRMMAFGDDLNSEQQGTLAYVRTLGKIRAAHSAITRGKREDLHATANKWCYKLSDGAETIIVGIASENEGGTCQLKASYTLVDLLNPGSEPQQGVSQLNFDSNKFQVYQVK